MADQNEPKEQAGNGQAAKPANDSTDDIQVAEDESAYFERKSREAAARIAESGGKKPPAEEEPGSEGEEQDANDEADSSTAGKEQESRKEGEVKSGDGENGDELPEPQDDDPKGVQERIDEFTRKYRTLERRNI